MPKSHYQSTFDYKRAQLIEVFIKASSLNEEVLYEKFNINHVHIQPEFQKVDMKDFIIQD